jgi:hypothetical protein
MLQTRVRIESGGEKSSSSFHWIWISWSNRRTVPPEITNAVEWGESVGLWGGGEKMISRLCWR